MDKQIFSETTPIGELTPHEPIDGLIILPERVDDAQVGYYGEQASVMYKDLAAMGANVAYYTKERKGIHRFSAGEDKLFEFLVGFFINGVGAAATYDVLKTYLISKFRKHPKAQIKGKVYIASERNGYSTWQQYEVKGSVDDAVKMIDKIQEIQNHEPRSRS